MAQSRMGGDASGGGEVSVTGLVSVRPALLLEVTPGILGHLKCLTDASRDKDLHRTAQNMRTHSAWVGKPFPVPPDSKACTSPRSPSLPFGVLNSPQQGQSLHSPPGSQTDNPSPQERQRRVPKPLAPTGGEWGQGRECSESTPDSPDTPRGPPPARPAPLSVLSWLAGNWDDKSSCAAGQL